MVKKKKEYASFHENGKRYMQCKHCLSEYVQTSENVVAVTCPICVIKIKLGEKLPLGVGYNRTFFRICQSEFFWTPYHLSR